ncbi:aspartate 1-decarboxylase (aspartate alpha-decarboxylase) [uncultured Anaerococcus sp.]|uniref:aspartate 1-decarboxylase (aspartate alpha-decarboxylase) n=1 Tax=uncultured Anaerococcus sp. TaxID=293428 RepID=UPI002889D5BC|nr:aspartate 1-decarboxylase (aspartate alpha-decarboxylase) [uncultured Anaerococcus sp.]
MIRDCKSGREIDIRESFLIVKGKVYAKESYIAFDTSKLKAYPPVVYYDREDEYLGSFEEEGLYEFSDIEDDLLSYSDYCFSNHDLDDLRDLLVRKREEFIKKLIK